MILTLMIACQLSGSDHDLNRQNVQVTYYDTFDNVMKEIRFYSDKQARLLNIIKKVSHYSPQGDLTHEDQYFTDEKSNLSGDFRHTIFYDKAGNRVRVETHHNQEKVRNDQILKSILHLDKTGAVVKVERLSTDLRIEQTRITKTVDELDDRGHIKRQVMYFVLLPEDIHPAYTQTIDFDAEGRKTHLTTRYFNRESNELGYYQSVFYYDSHSRKEKEEWFMTDLFKRDKQIDKMTFHFNPNGIKIRQEVVPTELGAQRLGVSKTVYFYNAQGTKTKMIQYYTAEVQMQKGYAKGVTAFDHKEAVIKEEIFDADDKLLELIQ